MEHCRIFLIEDDAAIAGVVERYLTRWGYTVRAAEDFQRVLDECVAFDPQLVLLDISLPFFNGYHWCRELRKVSKVPIVFLSSASDSMDLIAAMDQGGDDFIAKPFELPVLAAKLQALLRRTYDFGPPSHLLRWGGGTLNASDGTFRVGEKTVELTKNEWRLLQTLLERRGQVLRREELMARLWASDDFVDENTLSVNMARLRKKLEAAGATGRIVTKKGVGYRAEEA